jgi:hypothetical protein
VTQTASHIPFIKLALGLHHFNIAYVAGNEASYHRQVREAVLPFLQMLERHPSWQTTIEMSGFSLEFLAQHYPNILDYIKSLIENGQIELISCTYAPQLWIAYPFEDLIKSIEINLELLHQLELPSSRIFFTQENFFGPQVRQLDSYYDAAVVKDDYYYYLNDPPPPQTAIPAAFRFGSLDLIVGWGHILEEMARQVYPSFTPEMNQSLVPPGKSPKGLFRNLRHQWQNARYLAGKRMEQKYQAQAIDNRFIEWSDRAKQLLWQARCKSLFGSPLSFRTSKTNHIEWTWYHMGSGERYSKAATAPSDWKHYVLDPDWLSLAEHCLENIEKRGFRLATISTFLQHIREMNDDPPQSGRIINGAWNMAKSQEARVWLNWNRNPWEDDQAVIRHVTRSSQALRKAEANAKTDADRRFIAGLWKDQLLAETSDATGWWPEPCEVNFSLSKIDIILEQLTKKKSNLKIIQYKTNNP